ncbi:MAG: DedA family protein [Thermoanaerobaculales bacterium]
MMDTFTHLVAQHGYVALFSLLIFGIMGLPIPEETLLVFAGVLVYRGHLELAPTMVAAALGSACGISVSYGVGRSLGLWLTKRFRRWLLVTPERIDQVEAWFERVGHWSLFWGYFLPGVRHLTALVAGAAKLRYGDFALFAYGGAVLWSFSFISLGVLAGRGWSRISAEIHHNLVIAAMVLVGLAILVFGVRRIVMARK